MANNEGNRLKKTVDDLDIPARVLAANMLKKSELGTFLVIDNFLNFLQNAKFGNYVPDVPKVVIKAIEKRRKTTKSRSKTVL